MDKLITITNNTDWLRVPKSQVEELISKEPNWHITSKSKAKHIEVEKYNADKIYEKSWGSIRVVNNQLQVYYKRPNHSDNRCIGVQHFSREVCTSVNVRTIIRNEKGEIYNVQNHTYTMGEFLKGYRTPDDTSGLETIVHNTTFKVGRKVYTSEARVTRFNNKLHRIQV